MENFDLDNIWEKHGNILNSELHLNYSTLKNTNFKNTRRSLNYLLIRRYVEVSIFILITTLLINFIIENKEPQYIISGIVLTIFALVGAIGSIWQIISILRLDYSKPVTLILIQIEKLKIYSLQTLRLLILSVPFYFAYVIIGFKVVINFDIFSNSDSQWLISNVISSIILIPISIYLFRQLRINSKNNWLKKLIAENGGKQIDDAFNFLNEIEAFKK